MGCVPNVGGGFREFLASDEEEEELTFDEKYTFETTDERNHRLDKEENEDNDTV